MYPHIFSFDPKSRHYIADVFSWLTNHINQPLNKQTATFWQSQELCRTKQVVEVRWNHKIFARKPRLHDHSSNAPQTGDRICANEQKQPHNDVAQRNMVALAQSWPPLQCLHICIEFWASSIFAFHVGSLVVVSFREWVNEIEITIRDMSSRLIYPRDLSRSLSSENQLLKLIYPIY